MLTILRLRDILCPTRILEKIIRLVTIIEFQRLDYAPSSCSSFIFNAIQVISCLWLSSEWNHSRLKDAREYLVEYPFGKERNLACTRLPLTSTGGPSPQWYLPLKELVHYRKIPFLPLYTPTSVSLVLSSRVQEEKYLMAGLRKYCWWVSMGILQASWFCGRQLSKPLSCPWWL